MKSVFQREWVCGVGRSGHHNGSNCNPSEPHDPEWGCGFRWEASLTDAEYDELTEMYSVASCSPLEEYLTNGS